MEAEMTQPNHVRIDTIDTGRTGSDGEGPQNLHQLLIGRIGQVARLVNTDPFFNNAGSIFPRRHTTGFATEPGIATAESSCALPPSVYLGGWDLFTD